MRLGYFISNVWTVSVLSTIIVQLSHPQRSIRQQQGLVELHLYWKADVFAQRTYYYTLLRVNLLKKKVILTIIRRKLKTGFYRQILRVAWLENECSDEVLRKTETKRIIIFKTKTRQLKFLGDMMRKECLGILTHVIHIQDNRNNQKTAYSLPKEFM